MLSSMVTRSLKVWVEKYPYLVGELTDVANQRKAALDAAKQSRRRGGKGAAAEKGGDGSPIGGPEAGTPPGAPSAA
jgi:hypothetical protein